MPTSDSIDDLLAEKDESALILHRAPFPRPDDPALSYLGGLPRLPQGVRWPRVRRRDEDGEGSGDIAPTFVGQIDLADLPESCLRSGLPKRGTLYFFCNTQFVDVGDPSCKVIYHPESSGDFPECAPPADLMRLGGTYDRYLRPWTLPGSLESSVDFKFALTVEPKMSAEPGIEQEEDPPVVWIQEVGLGSFFLWRSPLLHSWPYSAVFAETYRNALLGEAEHARFGYDGNEWGGYDGVRQLIGLLPDLSGLSAFTELDEEVRGAWRRALAGFWPEFEQKCQSSQGLYAHRCADLLLETARHCARLGFSHAFFDQATDGGRLAAALASEPHHLAMSELPHQMLGAGTPVQDAPFEHASDVLLLQVSGADSIGMNDGCGGVLQFWVKPGDMKAKYFGKVVATYECG
jgi:Domain of unknown function (DUF1963)